MLDYSRLSAKATLGWILRRWIFVRFVVVKADMLLAVTYALIAETSRLPLILSHLVYRVPRRNWSISRTSTVRAMLFRLADLQKTQQEVPKPWHQGPVAVSPRSAAVSGADLATRKPKDTVRTWRTELLPYQSQTERRNRRYSYRSDLVSGFPDGGERTIVVCVY